MGEGTDRPERQPKWPWAPASHLGREGNSQTTTRTQLCGTSAPGSPDDGPEVRK